MLINGLKSYERLTRAQLDDLREHAQRHGVRVADLVVHKYDWLMTDFGEHVWTLRDSKYTYTINFDSPLFNGGNISDNPLLIADIKLYFIAAKTRQLSNCITVDGKSSCQTFVRHLKRYVIQSMALEAITNPQMLTKNEFDFVINSMAQTLPNSLGYNERLVDYFSQTSIKSIPIKRYKDKKSPSHVDTVAICESLNIQHKYLLKCERCKQTIAKASISVAAYRSNETFEISYLKSLDQETFRTMMHSDDYGKALQVLEGVQALYPAYRDLFNYELVKYPFNRTELVAKQDFSEEQRLEGRTRDIPPLLFLKMMDGAARYILDYADDLFEAEALFRERFDSELKKTGSNYQAGREVNAVIRKYKSDDKRKFTPFPLAAYKHAQERGDSKYFDISEDFIKEDEAGILTKTKLCERYKVPYNSLSSIRRLAYIPTNSTGTTGLSLNKALYQFMPFCCTVLIFALTARREMEVFGLQAGCTHTDADGNLWIDSYVAKTLQDDYSFTTVPIVDRAVKILERLSQKGREITGSNSLFVFDDAFNRKPINMKSITHIADDFFDFIGIERNSDGEHWKLSEHQFRRFFAIMYFYRYSDTNTAALMHELGHRCLAMTMRYLSQKRTADAMAEMDRQLQDIMAERIADLAERDDLGGDMFLNIKSLMISSIQNISIQEKAPDLKRAMFIKHIKANSLVFDFIILGMCFGNTPKLKPHCNCIRNGHVMLHEASESLCKGCPALLTVPEIAAGELHNLSSTDDGNSIILDALNKKNGAA